MTENLKREPIDSRRFTFDCRREFAARIIKAAKARNMTFSEFIRLAVREYLEPKGAKKDVHPETWR